MTTVNRKSIDAVYEGFEGVCMNERDRERARYVMRETEIADTIIWVKDPIASLGAMLPILGFRH